MKDLYDRDRMAKELNYINEQLKGKNRLWHKVSGQKQKLIESREALEKELAHVDQVISSYRQVLEKEITSMKKTFHQPRVTKGY